ncbi:MAG: NfeD family protein [Gammaproteobacteria bacterium]|nr:NfeD family protein [Gammaproteobacteria bacterium]
METIIINFWHWLILGLVLLSIELLSGTVVLLWIAAACVGTAGVVAFAPDLSWQLQLSWFSILTILSIVSWRIQKRFVPVMEDEHNSSLNRRGEQYIGRVFNLSEAIVNGSGKIKVDDSTWKVSGEDAEIGSPVKVTSVKGTVFLVDIVN